MKADALSAILFNLNQTMRQAARNCWVMKEWNNWLLLAGTTSALHSSINSFFVSFHSTNHSFIFSRLFAACRMSHFTTQFNFTPASAPFNWNDLLKFVYWMKRSATLILNHFIPLHSLHSFPEMMELIVAFK